MKDAYKSLIRNGTWELVNRPEEKILMNRWVFRKKYNQDGTKYKARFVTHGHKQ